MRASARGLAAGKHLKKVSENAEAYPTSAMETQTQTITGRKKDRSSGSNKSFCQLSTPVERSKRKVPELQTSKCKQHITKSVQQ
jgi:hypothetical protein